MNTLRVSSRSVVISLGSRVRLVDTVDQGCSLTALSLCPQDVFACMLRNLFEEYRFFPEYPERELQITAQLFGGIIEQNIVT